MDYQGFQNVLSVRKQEQAKLMWQGRVLRPAITALRHDAVLGSIELRPVARGGDAVSGIAHMSLFPSAGGADEIVATWDELDLMVACGLDLTSLSPRLNVLAATRHDYVVAELPYETEILPGRTPDGLLRGRPRWLDATLTPGPELPVPIEALREFSLRPLPTDRSDALAWCVEVLRRDGYTVSVAAPKPSG